MKILYVSEVASIHAARWVNQFKDLGWDLHVFQGVAKNHGVCPELKTGEIYIPFSTAIPNQLISHVTLTSHIPISEKLLRIVNRQKQEIELAKNLAQLIQTLKPDCIHSLGLNINWHNMMLSVYRAREYLGGFAIPWIYSSWGADLIHYAQLSQAHINEVKSVLGACDYHISECERDALLAHQMDFRGELLGYLPAYGGVTWKPEQFSVKGAPSNRRIILLKGRDISGGDLQGRAMSVMKAFELCKDVLRDYRIMICHAAPKMVKEAKRIHAQTGLDIIVMPYLDYESWLRIMGSARILVAATVTDGLPGTLVEAMSLGALPIHSGLDSIQEWIEDGKNGLLIPPEDPVAIAEALRRALADDNLVERAAVINQKIVDEKLSEDVVRTKAISMYIHAQRHGKTI